ncbi:MAG: M48 family metallopeptidase [Lachnospiraceae bacterium]|nr:M48 family metallopeptidase [Lachnospiraceae bacterium]
MTEYTIYDEAEPITLQVIYSKRKSLGLQVKSDGTVIVRVPNRVSDDTIRLFIEKHTGWILQKRNLWQTRNEDPATCLPEVVTAAGKRQIRQFITQRVAFYADRMGIAYGRITMRNQKTRWGSCSSDGNLNFNCRLLFVPKELVDYVVVHELAHRRHMDHSPAFWQEVEKYMPDYRERRKQLKQYSIE